MRQRNRYDVDAFDDNGVMDWLMYRARRAEARIQQMLWKVNYSDIVFINTVCASMTVRQ